MRTATVPDVVGLPLNDALSELARSGFELDGLIVGKGPVVVTQGPSPGADAPPDGRVAIALGDPSGLGIGAGPALLTE